MRRPDDEVTRVDLDSLGTLADTMDTIAAAMNDARAELLGHLAGGTGGGSVLDHDGVMVSLGTVDHPHAGRDAGIWTAAMLRACGDAYVAAEEGFRGFGDILRRVGAEAAAGDEVSAADLHRIMGEIDPGWSGDGSG